VPSAPARPPRKADVRSREPEVRSGDPEVRSREADVRSWVPEVLSREADVRSQEAEVRSREPEVRSREADVRSREPLHGLPEGLAAATAAGFLRRREARPKRDVQD
jgi:hypothetical protein